MQRLDGRVALVTGAGSGIGAAIAAELDAAGAELVLVGRERARLDRRAATLRRARVETCDVTDEAAVEALAEAVGPVGVLVCNAGAAEAAPLARTDLALWRRLIDVNATGTFLLCRAFVPGMVDAGHGRVVAVASTAGERGYAYVSAYCAAKHAVVGLVRALGQELAATGVTMNAVCPGYTETPLLDRSIAGIVAATGRDEEAARRALLRDNPQGRFVRPEEVASAVAWLCLDAQAAVTGRTITVAGAEVT
jgi:NAD(P)-dependent dehydrogenase (short-subunit alcohol dehydrogenase family)